MTKLSMMESDFLKELANIGIGHAATSLGELLKSKVDISLPVMSVIAVENIIGMKNRNFSAVMTGISGDLKGILVIIFSDETSFWLIDKMCENPAGTTKQYDEIGKSAMNEFSSIIGGSFLTSLSNFLGFNLMPKIPNLLIGKGYEIKEEFKKLIYGEIKDILSVKAELSVDQKKIEGEIYLILDKESFAKVFKKISA